MNLSHFAEHPERMLADECEDVLLRSHVAKSYADGARYSASDLPCRQAGEALGEDTPTVRSWGASSVIQI